VGTGHRAQGTENSLSGQQNPDKEDIKTVKNTAKKALYYSKLRHQHKK
jgi:hypothetical protein